MYSDKQFQADNLKRDIKSRDTEQYLKHGFRTTDFGQDEIISSNHHRTLGIANEDINDRIFLVSKGETYSSHRGDEGGSSKSPRKCRNRKKVIFEDSFELNGIIYPVNPKKSGLYEEILLRFIEQFEIAGQKWKRLFVYRFDLHSHFYSPDNKRISRFRGRLTKQLQRKYGFKSVSFNWVRELERTKAQHYHCVLILDGNLIRYPSVLFRIIKSCWENESGAHYVPVIEKPFYFGRVDEIRDEAIFRLSYLAKARGKGYRAMQSKDYQCSRLKLS